MNQELMKLLKEKLHDELQEIKGREREIIGMQFMLGMDIESLRPVIHVKAGIVKEGFEIFSDMAGLDAGKAMDEIHKILESAVREINSVIVNGAEAKVKAVPLNEDSEELSKVIKDWEERNAKH